MYRPDEKADISAVKAIAGQILNLPSEQNIDAYVMAAYTLAENAIGVSFRGGSVKLSSPALAQKARLLYGDPVGLRITSNRAPIATHNAGDYVCWDAFSCGCDQVDFEYKVKGQELPSDAAMGIARLAAWMYENRGDVAAGDPLCDSGALAFLEPYQISVLVA